MKTLRDWRPTAHDHSPADFSALAGKEDWLVAPVIRTRDSGALEESNWAFLLDDVTHPDDPENKDFEVHRFGHWGPGWYEILIVRPGTYAADKAAEAEKSLADYPSLDDERLCEREQKEADEVWSGCYTAAQRIEYIRKHRSQFEFREFADVLACVRGQYFAGYASDLIS